MATSGQTIGVIDVVINGTAFDVEKGAKVKIGGWKQNPVLVQGKVKYAREYEASEISFTTTLSRGQSATGLFPSGNVECQCNCDTGQSFVFSDAFFTNKVEVSAGEGGKIECKLAASEPEELLNG